MGTKTQRLEVAEVPPSDFEAGAVYALELFRARVQSRIDDIRAVENSSTSESAGISLVLNGARDLLATVRNDLEHLLAMGLRSAEASHAKAKEGTR